MNFIWIGDINMQPLVSVKWQSLSSSKQGGLQVLNIFEENKASVLRLAGDFACSNMPWVFLKNKYDKTALNKLSSVLAWHYRLV